LTTSQSKIEHLKPDGKIIIRQQFGVSETVTIQNFSEEFNTFYFAQYRTLEQEQKMLRLAGFEVLALAKHRCYQNGHPVL